MNLNLPQIPKIYCNAFIVTPVLTKIVLLIVMFCGTRNFYDAYDYQLYYSAAHNIFSGLLPWANGVPILYPPLAFIPMIISYIVSLITAPIWFFVSMWVLLSICDIITVFCIYYVGLKLYSKQKAFVAALLYATAISVMYFSLTKFDSFPTCIMMLAILFTIYGEKEKGYLTSIAGLFTKLWPIVIYPFLWIYNSRKKHKTDRAVLYLMGAAFLFVVMVLLGYSVLSTFTNFVYCNTIVFTINQYLVMLGIGLPFDMLVTVFRILLVGILVGLLYYQYKNKKDVSTLLKVILVAIMAIVFMIQYRSPQYNVWFIPLAALLLANRGWGIITFIGVQILCFIEFPIIWASIYVNDNYTSPLALWFFTLYFVVMGVMLIMCLRFDNTGIKK